MTVTQGQVAQCRINERGKEMEESEKKTNIHWVCQLAFHFEKVTHLTAPKMSRKNKGCLHCSMTCKFTSHFMLMLHDFQYSPNPAEYLSLC